MIDVLRVYPWRQRLKPLFGASIIFSLLLRPSYWPWPQTGDAQRVFLEQYLDRLVCAALITLAAAVIDFFVAWTVSCRAMAADKGRPQLSPEELQARLPHWFWIAFAATLLFKTFVDFAFAGRPLPADGADLSGIERWFDVIALAAFPFVYLFARWVGPPSNWAIIRAIVLRPPSEAGD